MCLSYEEQLALTVYTSLVRRGHSAARAERIARYVAGRAGTRRRLKLEGIEDAAERARALDRAVAESVHPHRTTRAA